MKTCSYKEISFKRCTKYRTSFLLYYNKGDSMNDKDIRKILISYLLAEGREIRIYQENPNIICLLNNNNSIKQRKLQKTACPIRGQAACDS